MLHSMLLGGFALQRHCQAKLLHNNLSNLKINPLIDRYRKAILEELANQLRDRQIQGLGQLTNGD